MPKQLSKLIELRIGLGLTQKQLAKLVGISHLSIWAYENGKYKPSITNRQKLRQFFNLPITDIFPKTEHCEAKIECNHPSWSKWEYFKYHLWKRNCTACGKWEYAHGQDEIILLPEPNLSSGVGVPRHLKK